MTGRELAQAAQRLADARATAHECRLALVAAADASYAAQDAALDAAREYARCCREYERGKRKPLTTCSESATASGPAETAAKQERK